MSASSSSSSALRALGIVLLVLGVLALAAGIVYLTVPTDKLPSFMGQIPHLSGHRSRRGLAGVVGAAILLLGGIAAFARSD